MAELILRPDEVIDMGEWDPSSASEVISILGDPEDTHTVYNTNGNQAMHLSLANIPAQQENSTFTSITATINARKGGKGSATTTVEVLNGGAEVTSTTLSITSGTITEYTTDLGDISSMNLSTLNGLTFNMTGTGNTQAYYQDVWVTLTYTDPILSNGLIILSSGLIQLTEGKLTLS
jgi:hypothetical protein